MKEPIEYLKDWSFFDTIPIKELQVIIKQIQEDAYIKALDDIELVIKDSINKIESKE